MLWKHPENTHSLCVVYIDTPAHKGGGEWGAIHLGPAKVYCPPSTGHNGYLHVQTSMLHAIMGLQPYW